MARTGFEKISVSSENNTTKEKQGQWYIKPRFGYMIAALVILVTLYAGNRVYWSNHLYVDGTIQRKSSQNANSKLAEDFQGWIESFTFTENPSQNEIRVNRPSSVKTTELMSDSIKELSFSGNETLAIPDGGTLRVLKYGFTGDQNEERQYPITYHNYIPDEEIDPLLIPNNRGMIFYQPSVVCYLESQNPSTMWVRRISLRDKTTGYYYSSSSGHSEVNRTDERLRERWSHSVHLFRQRPVELVYDVFCGEKIVLTMPKVDKHVETVGDCQIALVKAYAKEKGSGSGSGGFLYGYTPDGKCTGVSFVLSQFFPIQVLAITVDGEKKNFSGSTYGGGSIGYNHSFQFDVPYHEVESFEVTTWTDHYRAVYNIDEIFTLPKQANITDNLLKTTVKSVEFRSEWQFRDYLKSAMMMNTWESILPTFPRGYFPKKFEDVTVEELFFEYLKYIPNHGTPVINEEEGTLKIPQEDEQGWLKPVLDQTLK